MAISFGAAQGDTFTTNSNYNVVLSSAPADGTLMFLAVTTDRALAQAPTVGGGWQLDATVFGSNPGGHRIYTRRASGETTNIATVSVANVGVKHSWCYLPIFDADPLDWFDPASALSVGTGSVGTKSTGTTGTLAIADSLGVAVWSKSNNQTFSNQTNGYTFEAYDAGGLCVCPLVLTTTTAQESTASSGFAAMFGSMNIYKGLPASGNKIAMLL